MRWAREAGVEKILLSVYPHNTAAIALYRSFGFVEEGRLARQSRKSYGDEDEILMATWLGEAGDAGRASRAEDVSRVSALVRVGLLGCGNVGRGRSACCTTTPTTSRCARAAASR